MSTENQPPKEEKKEMISWQMLQDGRVKYRINYSSMNLLNTCPRKFEYKIIRNLVEGTESSAIIFGKAIHKALEHWYTLEPTQRDHGDELKEYAEMLAYGHNLDVEATGSQESIRQFVLAAPGLHCLPDTDKRSVSQGVKILIAYFKHYHNDGFSVLNHNGKPCIEQDFSFIIHEDSQMVIEYFGRIDVIMQNKQTGITVIADHKTTAALGSQFYSRLKPNHQYTGYVLGAKQCLGVDTNLFMINGIQVAKTKTEFARQITERDETDFHELKLAVIDSVLRLRSYHDRKEFPQNAPEPCSSYGSCEYLDVCQANNQLRETIIRHKWSV